MTTIFHRLPAIRLLCLAVTLNLVGFAPFKLVPGAEAATARERKQIRTLKRDNRRLKRKLAGARRELSKSRQSISLPDPFIELVKIGNPFNPADPQSSIENLGAVPYEYWIGKYEVTLDQYAAFLNAVAKADQFGLYDSRMESDRNVAGIRRSGSFPNNTYTVIGDGRRPVAYVSWMDAARFCNWLHHSRPSGPQNATTTEDGAYRLNGVPHFPEISRNFGAKYAIPNESEWYKAAYHQPNSEGGDTDDYWHYATASNVPPGNRIGPLPLRNHANYRTSDRFSVTQSTIQVDTQNYLTPVGSFPGSASYYGTCDQAGGVFEWTENSNGGALRYMRGGSWLDGDYGPRASHQGAGLPGDHYEFTGFRIVRRVDK